MNASQPTEAKPVAGVAPAEQAPLRRRAPAAVGRKRRRCLKTSEVGDGRGRSMLENRWPTYYSTDIRRLAAAISAIARFVAADCGVMHLASAANAPTAGLFRGTRIAEWGPYGPRDLALDVTSIAPEAAADAVVAADETSPH